MLVGHRVAAVRIRFGDGRRCVGVGKPQPDVRQLGGGIGLQPEMIEPVTCTTVRDREVHARVVEHPLGVIVLAHRRFGAEQLRIELDARIEIGHAEMNVKALHAVLLEGDLTAPRDAGAFLRAAGERTFGTQAATESVLQVPLWRQQFSVR